MFDARRRDAKPYVSSGRPNARAKGSTATRHSSSRARNVPTFRGTLSIWRPRSAASPQVLPHSIRSRYVNVEPQGASRSNVKVSAVMDQTVVDPSEYTSGVAELRLGKRLPHAVYLHSDAIGHVPSSLAAIVATSERLLPRETRWNVLKFATGEPKVSFLWYPRFFDEPFPELCAS